MDVYNTVWLSDYESCKSDATTQSVFSSMSPHSCLSLNSQGDMQGAASAVSEPHRPFHDVTTSGEQSASEDEVFDYRFEQLRKARLRLHRTLSLPESELALIDAHDLQERFTRLQVEQENKELRRLTRDLQQALEALEQKFIESNAPPEPPLSAYSADLAWSFFSSPQFDEFASKTIQDDSPFPRHRPNQIAKTSRDMYSGNKVPSCCIAQ